MTARQGSERAPGRLRLRWISVIAALVILGALAAWFLPDLLGGPQRRARRAYDRGRWAEVETFARQALKIQSGDVDARRLLARSLARLKRDGEAISIYQTLGKERLDSEDLFLVGASLLRKGNRDMGQAALESAKTEDPDNGEAIGALIGYYEQEDELTLARSLAEILSKIKGFKVSGFVALARISESLDDHSHAAAAWSSAFALDPKLVGQALAPEEALRQRARLALRLNRPDDALEYLKHDQTAEAFFLVSRARLQKGEKTAAIAALERSGGVEGRDPLSFDPSPYVGSARCAECHDAISSVQQTSRHAKTFRRGDALQDLPIPKADVPDPGVKGVAHRFRRRDDGRVVIDTLRKGDAAYESLVDFAFGSGDRGLTFVGHDLEGFGRELRLSHYGEDKVWGLTFGQNPAPRDPHELAGRSLSPDSVRRCVDCHVTRSSLGLDKSGPEAADHSIGCERCHGPGGNHVKAVETDFPDLAIGRPKQVVGPAIVNLCAGCHNPKNTEPKPDSPAIVRFQAATLSWSKCSTQSLGKLDCVTCHDPHRNAVTSHEHYEKRCLQCHSAQDSGAVETLGKRAPDARMKRTPCPVNAKGKCLDCHMPRDNTSVAHSTFTNHWIRVYPSQTKAAAAGH